MWFWTNPHVKALEQELARTRALLSDQQDLLLRFQRQAGEEREKLLDRLLVLAEPSTLRELRRPPDAPRPAHAPVATLAPPARFPMEANQRPAVHLKNGIPTPLSRLQDADDIPATPGPVQ